MNIKPLLADTTLSKNIKVTDYTHRKPMGEAHVITNSSSTITNANGEAVVKVAHENELVTITYMGYETAQVPFKQLSSEVILQLKDNELDAVEITGKRKRNYLPYFALAAAAVIFWPRENKTLKI